MHRRLLLAAATLLMGAARASPAPAPQPPAVAPPPPDYSSQAARWLELLAQYVRSSGGGGGVAGGGAPALHALSLPVEAGGAGAGVVPLPLLLLPVPVPVPAAPHTGCSGSVPGSVPSAASLERPGPVSSHHLLELFREQRPTAPHLPPAVFEPPRTYLPPPTLDYLPPLAPRGFEPPRRVRRDVAHLGYPEPSGRGYLPPAGAPPTPSFRTSMYLRGRLTVLRSDYTEPYEMWYDAGSGGARVSMHERAATSTHRWLPGDGTVRRALVRASRCRRAAPRPLAPDDGAPPALPDAEHFSFAGYVPRDGADAAGAERWVREVRGAAGELGAARGEALNYTHELLVTRAGSDAVPLRYSVSVDSSVLGARCDVYWHEYSDVRLQTLADDALRPPDQCEDGAAAEDADEDSSAADDDARFQPLREFTMDRRDPRHDDAFAAFSQQYSRRYVDAVEEAIRKNLLVQHTRFIESGNRQDAPHRLQRNFLSDRLDAELDVLLGAQDSSASPAGAAYPYTGPELDNIATRLPESFDWRERGAVTPVRYQMSCRSCWAFAVAGAVEGALFVRTRRLTPLSEQCLVDCAHTHGAHGCNGTWPVHAFKYVQDRGLPARDEYPEYRGEVLPCAGTPPVTHIQDHLDVPPGNLDALKVAIRRHAPAVLVLDSRPKSFTFYKSGVLQDERCAKGPRGKLNHAVLGVGWGVERGATHIVVKNSWSEAWGDAGYVRLHAPSNTCGVLTVPAVPRLRRSDVDRRELLPAAAEPAPGDER